MLFIFFSEANPAVRFNLFCSALLLCRAEGCDKKGFPLPSGLKKNPFHHRETDFLL